MPNKKIAQYRGTEARFCLDLNRVQYVIWQFTEPNDISYALLSETEYAGYHSYFRTTETDAAFAWFKRQLTPRGFTLIDNPYFKFLFKTEDLRSVHYTIEDTRDYDEAGEVQKTWAKQRLDIDLSGFSSVEIYPNSPEHNYMKLDEVYEELITYMLR